MKITSSSGIFKIVFSSGPPHSVVGQTKIELCEFFVSLFVIIVSPCMRKNIFKKIVFPIFFQTFGFFLVINNFSGPCGFRRFG